MNYTPEWLKKIANLPDIDNNIRTFGGHKQKVLNGWKAPLETHFAFEIMLIINGVQETRFEGRTMLFHANNIILIPPGTPHENKCVSEEGLEYFCLHFDIGDPVVQHQLLMYCPILLDNTNSSYSKIYSLLIRYVNLLNQNTFNIKDKLYVEMSLIELVVRLVEYTEVIQESLERTSNTKIVSAKTIAETIQENFREFTREPTFDNQKLLSMQEIAKSLNISTSTMLKTFKSVYLCSPKNYLDQIKYNEAKFLLQQPKISIVEIAEVIGYQSSSHFSRQFKTWSGVSPHKYRQVLQNQSIDKI